MKRVFVIGLLLGLPCLAQEPSMVRFGFRVDYSAASGSGHSGVTGANDHGAADVDMMGIGLDFPVYFGRIVGDRYCPVKLWPGVTYRWGTKSDSLAGGSTADLTSASGSRDTKATELAIQLPVRWYYGWDRQYTMGPYMQAGPFYSRRTNKVTSSVSGLSGGDSATDSTDASFGESRFGWLGGLGYSWKVYDSRISVSADFRRVNNPTVQTRNTVLVSLGIHY